MKGLALMEQPMNNQRNVPWARAFRIVVALLALIFFVEPFLQDGGAGDAFGGHYRYLTRWNFTLNTVIACWALLVEFRPKFAIPSIVASVALPMNTTVLLLYWGLYAIDPALVNDGGVPLAPVKEYYLHVFTSVFAFIECLYLHRPFVNMKRSLGGLVAMTFAYLAWIEFAVFPMNSTPCGTTLTTVCGLPYPFLNDMSGGIRLGFYVVAVLGIMGSIPLWNYLKNRLWETQLASKS